MTLTFYTFWSKSCRYYVHLLQILNEATEEKLCGCGGCERTVLGMKSGSHSHPSC